MSDANPLLSNKTMQGAAKAVEGLLDQGKINTEITDEPQKEAVKEEPKKTEAKAEDNSKVQEEEKKTEAQPEKEAEVEEEASEKENAEAKQETDLHQIIVNGEKIEVDLDELKAGYQKDADLDKMIMADNTKILEKAEKSANMFSQQVKGLNGSERSGQQGEGTQPVIPGQTIIRE